MSKVVLCEDDETIRDMYTLKFQESGFDIVTASDGETGLALIKDHKPDIALVDVMMPKMDGFAVLTELKKDESTKNIPVLLLTNLGQKADVEKGKQLGAVNYIVKASLTPAQVVEEVKKHLQKS